MGGAAVPIIGGILASTAGAAVSSALSPGGGTTTAIAKEPPEIEWARGEAIRRVSPILLDLLKDPRSALIKYAGITTLTPPLTEVEQAALQRVQDLFAKGLTTPLDQIALQRALTALSLRPSDLLIPELTQRVLEGVYGPSGILSQEVMRIISELTPSTPLLAEQIRTAYPSQLQRLGEDIALTRNRLLAAQQLEDVKAYIDAIQTLDKLQAQAADIARGIGGTAGWLQTIARAAPLAAFPRKRELEERTAYEDLMKEVIEQTLGMMRIAPSGKITTQKVYGIPFGQSLLSGFVSGLGTTLGQYFMNRAVPTSSPFTYDFSTHFTMTPSGLSWAPSAPATPSWSLSGGSTSLPASGFSLGASMPSWAR